MRVTISRCRERERLRCGRRHPVLPCLSQRRCAEHLQLPLIALSGVQVDRRIEILRSRDRIGYVASPDREVGHLLQPLRDSALTEELPPLRSRKYLLRRELFLEVRQRNLRILLLL